MQGLFGTIAGLLRELPEHHEFRQAMVLAAWRRVAGEGVVENSVPIELHGRKLTVAVSSETWRIQLNKLSRQFSYKLNKKMGANLIDEIEFLIDPDLFTSSTEVPQSASAKADDPEVILKDSELAGQAAAIGDNRLRKAFLIAACEGLAYRERNGR